MVTASRVRLVIEGQSNELGSGDSNTVSGPYGNPIKDPIGPNLGQASMWPSLSSLLGVRGKMLAVHNSAVGSTSIVDSWVGGCRAWVSNMIVARGSYILSGGSIWRSAVTAGTLGPSTVAPTGTADTTGADAIPWVYLGASAAGDVDGAVYAMGSNRFDPNGYCANAVAGFASPGFDQYVLYLALGQSDKTLSTTRARFSQGLQNAVAHALANGATKALVGFTCWGNTSGLTAYYDSALVPGWQDALTSLSSNAAVFPGANLYAELGTLPLVTAKSTTAGIFSSDNLHMNNEALKLAAARIDYWLQQAGV